MTDIGGRLGGGPADNNETHNSDSNTQLAKTQCTVRLAETQCTVTNVVDAVQIGQQTTVQNRD